MSHQEIMTELEQNGERSSGFYDEDARKLQEIYDAGFHEYVKKVKEERKQNKQRAQKQLRLQKKRLQKQRRQGRPMKFMTFPQAQSTAAVFSAQIPTGTSF